MSAKKASSHAYTLHKPKQSKWASYPAEKKRMILILCAIVVLLAVGAYIFGHFFDGFAFLEGRIPCYNDKLHGIEEGDIVYNGRGDDYYLIGHYDGSLPYEEDPDYLPTWSLVPRWYYELSGEPDGIIHLYIIGRGDSAEEAAREGIAIEEKGVDPADRFTGKTENGMNYSAFLKQPGTLNDKPVRTMFAYIDCGEGCVFAEIIGESLDGAFPAPEAYLARLNEIAACITEK